MATRSRREGRFAVDIWPGFVDALSTLILAQMLPQLARNGGSSNGGSTNVGGSGAASANQAQPVELVEHEGLVLGGSTGVNVAGAIRVVAHQ